MHSRFYILVVFLIMGLQFSGFVLNPSLFSINITGLPDTIVPLAQDCWSRTIRSVFPDAPAEYENASDICRGLTSGSDSSAYVLVDSTTDYAMSVNCGNMFCYSTILKYDSQVNLLWVHSSGNMTIGWDMCYRDGYLYTVGTDISGSTYDMFLTKWDSFGNVIWTATMDTGINEQGAAVGVASDGSVYVLSDMDPGDAWIDKYGSLLKYSSNGILLWNSTINHPITCGWSNIEVTSNSIISSDGCFFTIWDLDGNPIWSKNWQTFSIDVDENLYLSARYETERGFGIRFNKTHINGTLQWSKNFTIANSDDNEVRLECLSISVAPDGSILGFIESKDGWDLNHYLIKFASNGTLLWYRMVEYKWAPNFGSTPAYLSVAPSGVAYLATTIVNKDIGIFSYDVGIPIQDSVFESLIILFICSAVVGISIFIVVRFHK